LNEQKENYGLRKDPKLYKYVIDAFKRSKKFKEELKVMEKAEKYDKYYNNDPWEASGNKRADHLSEVKIAIAFDVIETGLPIVTARSPMPDVNPMIDNESEEYQQIMSLEGEEQESKLEKLKENLDDYAEKIQQELIDIWKRTKMQKKQRIGYRENCKVGNMFLKSEYDQEKKKWINTVCDISTIFPSPNVDSIEGHTDEPFCYAPVMSVEKVKRLYNITHLEEGSLGSFDDLKTFTFETNFFQKVKAAMQAGLEMVGSNDTQKGTHVIPIECYMPDNDESEIEVTDFDEKTGQEKFDDEENVIKKTVTRKNFPSGYKRVTVVLDNKDWILEEIDQPFKSPPFFGTINYQQIGNIFGISEIQNIEDLITIMNVSASNFNDNLRITGNPKLAVVQGSTEDDGSPITNEIGGIVNTTVPGGVYYVQPPMLGNDVKWWMNDFLRGWIDRITRLSGALRGFNEFSEDSGKKIRELRNAAHGSFQPKLDEQVSFIIDLFQYWTFGIQNYYQHTIMQKVEDDVGKANYTEFDPRQGKDYKLSVDVNADSILPDDPFAEFDEALALYDRGVKRTDEPLISAEHIIDLAVHLQDKQRAKNYLAKKENEVDQQEFENFIALAEQASDISDGEGPGDNEDQVVIQLIEILTQFPQFLSTNEFLAMPDRLRNALLAGVAKERTRGAV